MSIFKELKRRNVFRVGAVYVVTSWFLIQVASIIFPLFDFGDTPVRFVVIVLAIALIPVLVFAWVYELTPEGLKKERDVDRSQSIMPRVGRKLDRVIMLVLTLALAFFAFDKFILTPQWQAEKLQTARQEGRSEALVASYGDQSIAVLPFVDMSVNHDQEYMADGIAEELLNLLAKIPELRVISRTSAFYFKDKDVKLADVARELNVAHILEGSIRTSGNQIRITAQLIEARSDTHLWSGTYNRTLDDIFAVQDEIAAAVVTQLKLTLLGATPTVTETDPEAYALYLQARFLGRQGTPDAFEQALDLYQQALAIAPAYADAWAAKGLIHMSQGLWGLRPYSEGFTLAREAMEKALALDPGHAPSHSRLGYIAMEFDRNLTAAAQHMEKALMLDTNGDTTLANSVLLLIALGRFNQASAISKFLVLRDPVNPTIHFNLAAIYRFTDRYAEAIESYRTVLRLSPDNFRAQQFLGQELLLSGEPESALAVLERIENDEIRNRSLALAFYELNRLEEFKAVFSTLRERWGDKSPFHVALVYAWTGNLDQAFAWLEKAIELTGTFGEHSPLLKNLHNDPRWLESLERIGRSPTQLAGIDFTVTLPGQDEPGVNTASP